MYIYMLFYGQYIWCDFGVTVFNDNDDDIMPNDIKRRLK